MASPMWCCNSCSPWRPSEAPFVAKSYHHLVLVLSRGLQCGGPLNQKKTRTFINSRKQPKSPPEEVSEPKLSWDVFFCLFALKGSDGPLWLDQDKASRYSGVTNESGATRVVNLECFFLLMTTKWVFGILLVVLEGTWSSPWLMFCMAPEQELLVGLKPFQCNNEFYSGQMASYPIYPTQNSLHFFSIISMISPGAPQRLLL